MSTNPFFDAALDYARQGLAVIPLHWPENGGCSCGKPDCETPAKHPRWHKLDLEHGANSATTDEKIIRKWWLRWPKANVGIATGQVSGLIVVDIDPRNGGDKSFEKLPGIMPLTPTAHTGGGGEHYFFRHPANALKIKSKSELGGFPGIDQKAEGGYIVAPPSKHLSGGDYSWKIPPSETYPLAPIPDWLMTLLLKESDEPRRIAEGNKEDTIPKGKRNVTLTSLAGTMRQRGMTQEEIEAALLVANQNRCKPSLSKTRVLSIVRSVSRYEPGGNGRATRGAASPQQDERQETAWEFAAQLVPRIPFPWEVLPGDIADSLQQLGRACATSPYALPGAAFCMVSSIMGRTVVVLPKEGWEAPLIIWHMDIRRSGDGKTPPVRLMAGPIHDAQKEEEQRYEKEMEAYKRLLKQDQGQEPPPAPPRGYFVTDLTLEGLRDDLVNSPHGGIVVIQDEISAFLSGQNQYKSKGTDRESWLALHDGHPARIVRGGRTAYLNGARVSIFGGVQPKVFRTFFAGEDGLYLSDGTLFRFLMTCEPSTYYELTNESWEDSHRGSWETPLHRAIDWVEGEIYARGRRIENPARMILDSEAQGRFFDWRNQLYSSKDRLPAPLRGFLPKSVEYVLRLTGVINCIQMFSQGGVPGTVLSLEDLERGIKTVHFFLGQVQDALRLIENEDHVPVEISERSRLLAYTLERLRPNLDNGRLAIGFIHKQYNLLAPKIHKVETPKGMGAVIRAAGLTIAPGKHDANGGRGVFCLEWDQQSEKFISRRTSRTLERQCPRQETYDSSGSADVADIADFNAERKPFSPPPNWQEVPEGVAIPSGADVHMDMATGKNYARWPDGAENGGPGIGETEQDDLTDENPGASNDHVQCGLCHNFTASLDAPGGRGHCRHYEKSWNGFSTQFSDAPILAHLSRPGWGRH
ncbi:MAG: DUF3987 domain-containing protein [Desulfobacterales bacterium]|nr:DUF3987 domain-containing protein [Pseudomonadota bacterium]MCG2773718.1 DUF3987 domain-containing protein [Desulfobacterales bacterium]